MPTVRDESFTDLVRDFDVEHLAAQYRDAHPVRFFSIDDFLEPDFAHAVADAYPSFEQARESGKEFNRLNILVYLTPDWRTGWGGDLELWDRKVRQRADSFAPRFNRCLVFNTTHESFHGVTAIACPPPRTRNSFAAYYYTAAPPANWNGHYHSTIYRARPGEWRKRFVDMPIAKGRRTAKRWLLRARSLKHQLVAPR